MQTGGLINQPGVSKNKLSGISTLFEMQGRPPEPEGDTFEGEILYGIEFSHFGGTTTSGLVKRKGRYDFEELRFCPDHLKIPGQNGGLVPKVDKFFVHSLEISAFDILGCAVKSTDQPGRPYELVVLDIKDPASKEELQHRRQWDNYRYDGPLVCTLYEYRKRFGEDGIEKLENQLKKTMSTKDILATGISLKKAKAAKASSKVHVLQPILINQQMHNNGTSLMSYEVRAIA
ncbi:hypothetical protein IG631_22613 [Alternaria alternata]|nr:hypothetical protein IG631_22613 [Alternaria alternata]